MRKTESNYTNIQPRLMTLEGLKTYLSCGRNAAISIAEEANASRKLGGRRLFDRLLIDSYLNAAQEQQEV